MDDLGIYVCHDDIYSFPEIYTFTDDHFLMVCCICDVVGCVRECEYVTCRHVMDCGAIEFT